MLLKMKIEEKNGPRMFCYGNIILWDYSPFRSWESQEQMSANEEGVAMFTINPILDF